MSELSDATVDVSVIEPPQKSRATSKREKDSQSQTVVAIERAADVLIYLADTGSTDSGVTEIANDLGITKAAVYRILSSLRSRGLVTLNENTHRYDLGPTILRLGLTYLDRIDVRQLAAPRLAELSAATRETATLSVRIGNTRVYVEQVTPDREVIMSVQLGVPYPLHAGASSKAFLAFLDADEIDVYLAEPLDHVTRSTIVDKQLLRKQLDEIRERGWAISTDERQVGAASVAAPVFNHAGVPCAVISVAGPKDRLLSKQEKAVKALLTTTENLSNELGYSSWRPARMSTRRAARATASSIICPDPLAVAAPLD